MGALPLDQVVARAAVLWRRSGDQILIRRRGNDEIVVLAATAASLWDCLQTPRPMAELVDELGRLHETDPNQIAPDVQAAVDVLVAQQAVTLGD